MAEPENPGEGPKRAALSRKAVEGGVWVVASRFSTQFLALVKLIVLARILSPDDFGIMGIALMVVAVAERFSQTGLQQALIQKPLDIRDDLNLTWTFLLLRGLFLCLMIVLLAPWIAVFFHLPRAVPIIRVMGISLLVQSLGNIGIVYFHRELIFKKQFFYQVGGDAAEFVTALILALTLRNVWALALGLLAGRCMSSILSYALHAYRPRWSWNGRKLRALLSFGKWISFSNIFIFISSFLDTIVVGKLLGAASLGYYRIAYQISHMPSTEITQVVSQVSFPAFAKIQQDVDKLSQAYHRVLRLTMVSSFPVAILIAVLVPDFTTIFLGPKWLPIIPAVQLLVFSGLLKSIASTGSPLFMGCGQPRREFYMQFVRAGIMMLAVWPFTRQGGLTGTSWAVVLSSAGMFFAWGVGLKHIVRVSLQTHRDQLKYPLVAGTFMIGALGLYKSVVTITGLPLISSSVRFAGAIMAGTAAYIGALLLFKVIWHDDALNEEIKLIVQTLSRRKKGTRE